MSARRLGEPITTDKTQVKLELFWNGIRDHLEQVKKRSREAILKENVAKLVGCYEGTPCLSDLSKRIEEYCKSQGVEVSPWHYQNYRVSGRGPNELASNIFHTEIDIVLETPERIYIGEAKYEEDLGENPKWALAHQLVREYVAARVLVSLTECKREVVPFTVWRHPRAHGRRQTAFMIWRGWMSQNNVLTWMTSRSFGYSATVETTTTRSKDKGACSFLARSKARTSGGKQYEQL